MFSFYTLFEVTIKMFTFLYYTVTFPISLKEVSYNYSTIYWETQGADATYSLQYSLYETLYPSTTLYPPLFHQEQERREERRKTWRRGWKVISVFIFVIFKSIWVILRTAVSPFNITDLSPLTVYYVKVSHLSANIFVKYSDLLVFSTSGDPSFLSSFIHSFIHSILVLIILIGMVKSLFGHAGIVGNVIGRGTDVRVNGVRGMGFHILSNTLYFIGMITFLIITLNISFILCSNFEMLY